MLLDSYKVLSTVSITSIPRIDFVPSSTNSLVDLKATSNGPNMLVKHYPTLLGGVDQCWIVLNAGVFKRIHATPSNNVEFQYQAQNDGVFLIMRTKILDDVG